MLGRSVSAVAALAALAGCAESVHAELPPETSITCVESAPPALRAPPLRELEARLLSAPSPASAPSTMTALVGDDTCVRGGPHVCWEECFDGAVAASCHDLALMFARGEGVSCNLNDARRLNARACGLGDCRALPFEARMTAPPGAVVVVGGGAYRRVRLGE